MNPFYSFTPYLFNISFNIIFPSTPRSPKKPFSSMFSDRNLVSISHLCHTCHMTRESRLHLITVIIIRNTNYEAPRYAIFPGSWYFLSLMFKYFLLGMRNLVKSFSSSLFVDSFLSLAYRIVYEINFIFEFAILWFFLIFLIKNNWFQIFCNFYVRETWLINKRTFVPKAHPCRSP